MKKFINANKKIFGLIVIYFTIFIFVSLLIIVIRIKPEKEVKVPSVTGEKFIYVYNKIIRNEMDPELSFYDARDVDEGIVLSQYPAAGAVVKSGSRLRLVISRNNLKVDVPQLVGSELSIAKNKLSKLHIGDKTVSLGVGSITYIPSEKSSENIVIDQTPKSGEKINPDEKVNLLVSTGDSNKNNRMPNVVGQSINLVFDLLMSKGVVVKQKFVNTGSKSKNGLIVSQYPKTKAVLKEGTEVTLTIVQYRSDEHYYRGYEHVAYTIPADDAAGYYEVVIEDDNPERIRFASERKPGDKIEFMFYRTGNAKIKILKNKKFSKALTINVDSFE